MATTYITLCNDLLLLSKPNELLWNFSSLINSNNDGADSPLDIGDGDLDRINLGGVAFGDDTITLTGLGAETVSNDWLFIV